MIDTCFINGILSSVELDDIHDYVIVGHNISRETRFNESAKPRQHGIFQDYTWLGKMSIEFEIDINGTDAADYHRKRLALQSALIPLPEEGYTYVCELVYRFTGYTEDMFVFADLDTDPEIPMDGGYPSVGHCHIMFRCPFPYFTGANLYSQPTGTPSGTGGRTYIKTYPFDYGGSASGGEVSVTPSGNVPSPPIIRITGPCTNPTVTKIVGGIPYTFAFNDLQLSTGEYVDVDMYARTVINNGGFNVKGGVAPGSVWWGLTPGIANDILYRAFDYSAPSQATISYRNIYKI